MSTVPDMSAGSSLTVLGSCGAWPEPGRACAGFLLRHDGAQVVIDLGYGTLSPLLSHLGSATADGIDAVIISHAHPDHMLDLHGLMRARWYGRRGAAPIPLLAPQQVADRLVELEDGNDAAVRGVFEFRALPSGPQQAGPFTVESAALPHYVPNAGVRLSAPGLTIAYTGDCGPDPAVAVLGRKADLLIADATDREQQPDAAQAAAGQRLNMTAADAGAAATAARAGRLMLTHFWPGNDRQASAAVAASGYDGEILLAAEGLQVSLR
jgi:ribonuclease BN (tRNA processing enzyme)